MTSRLNESCGSTFGTQSDARSNQVSLSPQNEEEGCPVVEESGTVCGETRTLNVFQDFRAIYDNIIRKMEGNKDDNLALRKLAPFRKLVEDLWEQNAVLVETVEELEEEAACRVTMLQNKLDECSEKVNEYLQDIDSLIEVIRRFRENGKLDSRGLKFNSICDFQIHGYNKSSCDMSQETNAKERYHKIAALEPRSRKSIVRGISTNTNEFCSPVSNKDTSRSLSRQYEVSPSSTCSEYFSKPISKLPQSNFEEPEKCGMCSEAKLDCECEETGHIYRTPEKELSVDDLLEDTNRSNLPNKFGFVKSQLRVKADDGDEVIESFYSAEDCTKEIMRRERTAASIRKFDKRVLKSVIDEQIRKKSRVDWCDQGNVNRSRDLEPETSDIENLLKQKDREICCLTKQLSGKDELLCQYYSQIDELKRDLKTRSKKYQQIVNRLKDGAIQRLSKCSPEDFNVEGREFDDGAIEVLFNAIFREMDKQKLKLRKRMEEAEFHVKNVSIEKNKILTEKTDMKKCLEDLRSENSSLRNELACFNNVLMEKDALQSRLEEVKGERDQLLEKVNSLHHSIQELDTSFKETRWALTAEVAEKHDQVQELKRTVACLEEQVRQADMKTLFKDDVIKEMRKELKHSRMSVYTLENVTKVPVRNISPFGDKRSWNSNVSVKENFEEDLKLDIHIFPLKGSENQKMLITRLKKYFSENICSVEDQRGNKKKAFCNTRNVSTQHTTRVQKLPRSFGTLTVTPWSGAGVEAPISDVDSHSSVDNMKKLKQLYQVPCSSLLNQSCAP